MSSHFATLSSVAPVPYLALPETQNTKQAPFQVLIDAIVDDSIPQVFLL